jgi:diaminopimelate epimerase
VDRDLTVHMPGGTIGITLDEDYAVLMTGTVNQVAAGTMHRDLFLVTV